MPGSRTQKKRRREKKLRLRKRLRKTGRQRMPEPQMRNRQQNNAEDVFSETCSGIYGEI